MALSRAVPWLSTEGADLGIEMTSAGDTGLESERMVSVAARKLEVEATSCGQQNI